MKDKHFKNSLAQYIDLILKIMYQMENFESEIERQTRETFLNRNKKVDEWIFKHVVRNLV